MADQPSEQPIIGNVLRASTVGFVCGTRSENIAQSTFGEFVRTRHGDETGVDVIGVIHAISIDDDPMVRQMIMANNMNPSTVRDQRAHRMVPVEISVLNVGYVEQGVIYQMLPPRPPLSLDHVELCTNETIRQFTARLDFLRLMLDTSDVPAEQLLAASLRIAAQARPEAERVPFLVDAGRRLAALLAHDLPRLQHVLQLIKPV
ncbi:MAG: hypothetical protein K8S97_06680 [Anaerolineae bacterium]|nr:hypothetical protein [Anaerolineae bacterium]